MMRMLVLIIALFAVSPISATKCETNTDCNAGLGGICIYAGQNASASGANSIGCICPTHYGGSDCEYKRLNSVGPGVLNVVLPLFGLGGIGNIQIGRAEVGAAQLALTLPWFFALVAIIMVLLSSCCLSNYSESFNLSGFFLVALLIVMIVGAVAGIIWSWVDGGLILNCKVADGWGYDLIC